MMFHVDKKGNLKMLEDTHVDNVQNLNHNHTKLTTLTYQHSRHNHNTVIYGSSIIQ